MMEYLRYKYQEISIFDAEPRDVFVQGRGIADVETTDEIINSLIFLALNYDCGFHWTTGRNPPCGKYSYGGRVVRVRLHEGGWSSIIWVDVVCCLTFIRSVVARGINESDVNS